jgi:hypothetical protein
LVCAARVEAVESGIALTLLPPKKRAIPRVKPTFDQENLVIDCGVLLN